MLFDAIGFDMLVLDVNLMDSNKVSLKGKILFKILLTIILLRLLQDDKIDSRRDR